MFQEIFIDALIVGSHSLDISTHNRELVKSGVYSSQEGNSWWTVTDFLTIVMNKTYIDR